MIVGMDEPKTSRASICMFVGSEEAFDAGYRWLRENRSRLGFISENLGCGCCVDHFDLEGPPEVLATIPDAVRSNSLWAEGLTNERAAPNTDLDLY
jgi:hypothetical protein